MIFNLSRNVSVDALICSSYFKIAKKYELAPAGEYFKELLICLSQLHKNIQTEYCLFLRT